MVKKQLTRLANVTSCKYLFLDWMCNVELSLDTLIIIGKGHLGLVIVLNYLSIHANSAVWDFAENLRSVSQVFTIFDSQSRAFHEARDVIMNQVLKHVIMSDNAHKAVLSKSILKLWLRFMACWDHTQEIPNMERSISVRLRRAMLSQEMFLSRQHMLAG